MSTTPNPDRADAMFKKEQRQRDGEQAMAEYEAERRATLEKTARLRALRLARDAGAAKQPPAKLAPAKPAPAKPALAKPASAKPAPAPEKKKKRA